MTTAKNTTPPPNCLPDLHIPPTFPQAKNGIIDVSLVNLRDPHIYTRLQKWGDISESDVATAYWNYTASQPLRIGNVNVPIDVPIDTSKVPNGCYNVWYTVIDAIGNCSYGPGAWVEIINSTANYYIGPEFPDAINSVLSYSTVSSDRGTPIRARYETISEGDTVTFYWQGFDAYGHSVPEATYTSPSLPVGPGDVTNGYVDGFIPEDDILVLQNYGFGQAYYVVTPANKPAVNSLTTQVYLSMANIKQLRITGTIGAPVPHSHYPTLQPWNWVSVFGTPGTAFTASVGGGGSIVEANGESTWDAQLLGNGLAHFRVSGTVGSVTAVAIDPTVPGRPPATSMKFEPIFFAFKDPHAIIKGYNYTTHVPCDGIVPCSIYVVANTTQVDHLWVNVTGSPGNTAKINRQYPPPQTVPLDPQGAVTITIIDTVAETVHVTLGHPTTHAPLAQFDVEFFAFPGS